MTRIGSLFSGYGGLDMGVQSVIGGEVAWHVEYDAAPSKILKHHWPTVPNYGDITTVDWDAVEPVDVLTGGFPCQDVSLAGRRAGITDGTRSGLWSEYAHAIDKLRPRLVVIENVRGLLSAKADGPVESDPWGVGDGATGSVVNAFGVVLGDLASLGYDARWCGVRAADAGAPHGRFRVFVLAYSGGIGRREGWSESAGRVGGSSAFVGGSPAYSASVSGRFGHGDDVPTRRATIGREPATGSGAIADAANNGHERAWITRHGRVGSSDDSCSAWGQYWPAISRWERTLGRVAPSATRPDGKHKAHRLNPAFVEWMMGLPAGHVTDPAIGLTRTEQLKALGNGVVPQQAALAVTHLLSSDYLEAAA